MYILGISSGLKHGHHDGAAVLIKNGKIIFAAEEERFTLTKHARSELPTNTIRYILKKFKLSIRDISFVCSPLKTYPFYSERISKYIKFHFGYCPKVSLFDHHECHAASSFYPSGYDEAAVVCLDNSGDSKSGAIYLGKNRKLIKKFSFDRENSLGLYYGMITQYLGFQMTNDEYKVMGLASYGKNKFENEFKKILKSSDEFYKLDADLDVRKKNSKIYTTDFSTRQERIFTEKLEKILGKRRLPGKPISQRFIDIAHSGQERLNEIVFQICKYSLGLTTSKNLCMAGGVALNCQTNLVLTEKLDLNNIYIPSAPNDAGVALGAAILESEKRGFKTSTLTHAYLGPQYSNAYIKKMLTDKGIKFKEYDYPEEIAAKDILDGKITAWLNGRMEFGPRALGARSILADPRNKNIKKLINKKIKYREEFRPFCPSVLSKNTNKFYEESFYSPFMNINKRAKKNTKNSYPSIVHSDNTSRIQSVKKIKNQLYFELLSELEKKDNLQNLLNTSLNINEQTMVNHPSEALHTFFCSGLDSLFIENFKIFK